MNPEDIFKGLQQDNELRTAKAKLDTLYRESDSMYSTLQYVLEHIPAENEIARAVIRARLNRFEETVARLNLNA